MFPRIGDRVRINPEWVEKFDSLVPSYGNYKIMKDAGFVGKVLIVENVNDQVVIVGLAGQSLEVYLTARTGLYQGLDHLDKVPYFIHASETTGDSRCPVCGNGGWLGFNMFHCDNSGCPNGR